MTAIPTIRRYADLSKPAGQPIAGGQLVYATIGPVTRNVTDGSTNSGSATITSNSANFQQADVGDTVTGAGIPAGAVILAYNSATSVTLSVPATATATGVSLSISVPPNPDGLLDVDVAYVAGAGQNNVLGVALIDAQPRLSVVTAGGFTTPAQAFPIADRVTIGGHGQYPVTYAAAAGCGQLLKAAAGGAVTPFVVGTDTPDLRVGYCTATTAAGAVGTAYIGR